MTGQPGQHHHLRRRATTLTYGYASWSGHIGTLLGGLGIGDLRTGTYEPNSFVSGSGEGFFQVYESDLDGVPLLAGGGAFTVDLVSVQIVDQPLPVAEPASLALFGIGGLAGLGFLRRRRRC